MCDYSLLSFRTRLAVEGEQLLTYRFPSFSIGLAAPAEMRAAVCSQQEDKSRPWWSRLKSWLFPPESRSKEVTAVCIPPGACLRLVGVPPPLQQKLGGGPVEDVIWTELSASRYEYRDAIHFTNGRRVLLQDLHEGVYFEVLSLDTKEHELAHGAARVRRS